MKAIEATAVVGPDRKLVVQLPPDVSTGEHRVVVVIDEPASAEPHRPLLRFTPHPIGLTSDSFTFRREDLYGDAV
jgi:hypothetical protein